MTMIVQVTILANHDARSHMSLLNGHLPPSTVDVFLLDAPFGHRIRPQLKHCCILYERSAVMTLAHDCFGDLFQRFVELGAMPDGLSLLDELSRSINVLSA